MATVITRRPTGDGMYQEFTPFPADPASRYDKVDEEVADDDATYIEATAGTAKTSSFTKDTILSGLPVSVAVKMRGKSLSGGSEIYCGVCLIIGGTRYSLLAALGGSYAVTYNYWSKNPATNAPWTLNDINNLEIGVYQSSASGGIRVTQVWLEVTMADNTVSVSDYGTNQQEAVGMGAVYDPRFEGATVNVSMAVADTGVGVDAIASLLANLTVADVGTGAELATINASMVVLDLGNGVEGAVIAANIPVGDTGHGTESAVVNATVQASDSGAGYDFISPAKAYFFVTSEGVLTPLGVIVLRDSRQDLLPGTRENTESVPGRHGEIDFGSEFQSRLLELHVASKSEFDRNQREQIKRTLAKWLNPVLGPQNLIFADDVERTYRVKYAGKIDLSRMLANWLEFTIPFKASDPFIIGSFEKQHVGSGTLTNEGTFETPVVIEITGPVTNPSVTVGSDTLTWTGTVGANDKLEIDTEYMTVKFNGVNAIANYSGGFPKLQPGDTTVTAASGGTTTWKWRDRWV